MKKLHIMHLHNILRKIKPEIPIMWLAITYKQSLVGAHCLVTNVFKLLSASAEIHFPSKFLMWLIYGSNENHVRSLKEKLWNLTVVKLQTIFHNQAKNLRKVF